ncbi:regulatory-associated protein of TOR 1 [Actinidia rufa]|uniref:Regulatory-associated protein of TOR 1 n=1 Tax=Actinidia rufa TaxID=165716 RepID=A0A7J0EBJ5_9ERIC|nr:regulatory-associated protein of TOR 1 [Actinidia rufa]
MALGDLMASRYSQSTVVLSNCLDECSTQEYVDFVVQRRDGDSESATSSYGNATVTTNATVTSIAYLPQTIVLCELRHEAFEGCVPFGPSDSGLMRTGCVALVLCLNISVQPPDVIKISPCARMECWIDPFSMAPRKALETIGNTLSLQYERWQPKSYTQYIPLPIIDLDSWLKTPSIYVFDCSAAGLIVNAFTELQEWSSSGSSMRDCILLAACEAHESLPQSAEFPADVFTSCLTTPIKMALRWDAWDMAGEICLSQLPTLLEDPNADFQPSPFFTDQLAAFEVWLDHGSEQKKPPEQLPIVLQVLLSQCHRFRALVLLGRFLDMGPWAVDLALSVGIFPHVLKLLQTTTPELQQILVFIWTKILALDKSCQVDLVKDRGHTYFIRFLDSVEAYPEQRAMAAFVLAVIVDGHRQGQEACIEAGLLHVCLKHLHSSTPNDAQTEPLFLQWLCLCLGKVWEDCAEAQIIGLQADAPSIYALLLSEPQPEVRASTVFALGTLLDVGIDSSRDIGGNGECDDDEKVRAENSIVESLLNVVSDGSPLVRAEVAIALARFAFGHNKHLKSIAAAYCKPQSNSILSSLPSLAMKGTESGYTPTQCMPHASMSPSQIGPLLRVGGDSQLLVRDGRVSTSSPLTSSGIMPGSPLSDDLSQHSDSGMFNGCMSNGVINHRRPRPLDNALYSQCVLAMLTLAKDPSPRVASLGRRVLSIIGIEQVVTKYVKSTGSSAQPGESVTPSHAGLARSSSWFDMNGGHLALTFRTPPVSPPRPSYLPRMRRVWSLEFRPHLVNSPDIGLADPLLGRGGAFGVSERSFLPQSSIYSMSCCHFSKPLLTAADDSEEMLAINKLHDQIASWDTKFETGTKSILLQPFGPVVIAADENERIRIWNYEEATLLNSFENHDYPDKGISKLSLVNELDDSLLLVASCDGNVRIWKDYTLKSKQRLVTAFSSIQGHRPGVRSVNAVVDWQQQSRYLYASGEISSVMVWDLDKEQLVNSIPSSSDCSITALSASQVHAGQFAAGYVDGSVRLFDIRSPELALSTELAIINACDLTGDIPVQAIRGFEKLVCTTRPHTQRVERVVGIAFQPGLDPTKIISASQAGDIQFLDIRWQEVAYLTIDAHKGYLTALAVHRHAPVIASGSTKELIKVFNLKGEQLGSIRYSPNFMAQKIGSVSCLAFHPYQVHLAAGAANALLMKHLLQDE